MARVTAKRWLAILDALLLLLLECANLLDYPASIYAAAEFYYARQFIWWFQSLHYLLIDDSKDEYGTRRYRANQHLQVLNLCWLPFSLTHHYGFFAICSITRGTLLQTTADFVHKLISALETKKPKDIYRATRTALNKLDTFPVTASCLGLIVRYYGYGYTHFVRIQSVNSPWTNRHRRRGS